jgi:hypothetical protein
MHHLSTSKIYLQTGQLSIHYFTSFPRAISLTNAPDLDLLCQEFRFTSLGRQHASFDIFLLKSAPVDVQKQLAEEDRQICLLIAGRGDDAEIEPTSDHDAILRLREAISRFEHHIDGLSEGLRQLGQVARGIVEASAASSPRLGRLDLIDAALQQPLPPSGPPRIKGLIQCLTERCGARIPELGVVAVTASSNVDSTKNAVDLESGSCYVSAAGPSSWICIDFKDMWITPSSYSIVNCGDGAGHLKNCVIEGSKDGEDWVVLDRRENCDDMKEGNAVGAFSMFRSDKVRLIRLRKIGLTHSGQSFFGLARFEIYGSLLSRDFEVGLIARQTQECGKDVHDAGLVICSASGKCDE